MHTLSLSLSFGILAVSYFICSAVWNRRRYTSGRQAKECGTIHTYKHVDPLLGIDFVYRMLSNLKKHRWLEFQKELWAELPDGCKTFEAKFLGSRMIYSCNWENMKAMSTDNWKDFGVQPIRQGNGVVSPFTGHGVSTTDGALWQFGRDLVKPYFDRKGYSNLHRLQVHVDRLLSKVPTDGSTFDIQPLFRRWVS
jgi:cytochrome P450 monooxygenase